MGDIGGLLAEHLPNLQRYARRLTRNGTDADDLVQAGLVRAFAYQHRWAEGTKSACLADYDPAQ
jgi:DNA-directed RNA polymerase specialized sigma24 family protein